MTAAQREVQRSGDRPYHRMKINRIAVTGSVAGVLGSPEPECFRWFSAMTMIPLDLIAWSSSRAACDCRPRLDADGDPSGHLAASPSRLADNRGLFKQDYSGSLHAGGGFSHRIAAVDLRSAWTPSDSASLPVPAQPDDISNPVTASGSPRRCLAHSFRYRKKPRCGNGSDCPDCMAPKSVVPARNG